MYLLLTSATKHCSILPSCCDDTMIFLIAIQNQMQLKSFQIPILVIGTKADMVDDKERIKELNRGGNIGNRLYQINSS